MLNVFVLIQGASDEVFSVFSFIQLWTALPGQTSDTADTVGPPHLTGRACCAVALQQKRPLPPPTGRRAQVPPSSTPIIRFYCT
jgi:hypothetical protein